MEEELILVDVNDQQTGVAKKLYAHEKGLLHRAFSIFLFDRTSRLLLQQRADGKYHSPGLWSNTCCGHPRPGEETEDAAKRRLFEEMGLICPLTERFTLIYREPVSDKLTEYEYDHVFVGLCDVDPTPAPDEAKAWRWVKPVDLLGELHTAADRFTVWLRTIVLRAGLRDIQGWAKQAEPALSSARLQHSIMPFHLPGWLENADYPLSPYADEAQLQTRQWLRNLGMDIPPNAAHKLDTYIPGLYAGFMWSDAPHEIFLILSDLMGWFSCIDDLADEDCNDPDLLEETLRGVYSSAFTSNTLRRGPIATGLADIIRRAARLMPPLWKQRAAEQYANYLCPCATALMHRANQTQPGIEGYDSLWRNAGGFQLCLEFTYLAKNIHLSSSLYYSKPWQELCLLTLNLLKAVNDLLSFRIMENPDEDIYNLLTHLRHTQGYSAEQAALEVAHRIGQWAEDFANAQALLPERLAAYGYDERALEQATICAQAFHEQWRGNIAWHLSVPRYREIRFKGE